MDNVSHWLPGTVIGASVLSDVDAGASGREWNAGLIPAARRLIDGARRRLARGTPALMSAADGASDAELERLARRGTRLAIDDVRWDFVRSRLGAVRRWH